MPRERRASEPYGLRRIRRIPLSEVAVVALALAAGAPEGVGQEPRLVSTSSIGTKADGASRSPSSTAGGGRVAFDSRARNLHPRDGDTRRDVFVKDEKSSAIWLASETVQQAKGNGESWGPSIDGDGRRVAFISRSTNLHWADSDARPDVYVKDFVSSELYLATVYQGETKGNGSSNAVAISRDGSWVVFDSTSSNWLDTDGDSIRDVYAREVDEGILRLVSINARGAKGNGASIEPAISGDGRTVGFSSVATNLTDDDGDATSDVYVKSFDSGFLRLVSRDARERKGNGESRSPSLSSDGTRVAFATRSSNFDSRDGDDLWDVYVKDLETGSLTLVSAVERGAKGNGDSIAPTISAEGNRVSFLSRATNLDPADSDERWDVYVKDLVTGELQVASLTEHGVKGNQPCLEAALTPDGSHVVYSTASTNLSRRDTDALPDIYDMRIGAGEFPIPLRMGEERTVLLTWDVPSCVFALTPDVAGPIAVILTDPTSGDVNALYASWDRFPTPATHEFAAAEASRKDQRLAVPEVRGETLYLLARANEIVGNGSRVTVRASQPVLSILGVSPGAADPWPGGELTLRIRGLGFDATTRFALEPSGGGRSVSPLESTILGSGRAESVFPIGGLAAGLYDLRGTRAGGGSARSPGALRLGPPSGAIGPAPDRFAMEGASPCRYLRWVPLSVRYMNGGSADLASPLMRLTTRGGTQLRVVGDEAVFTDEILFLGAATEPPAGAVSPGGESDVALLFRITDCFECRVELELASLEATSSDAIAWSRMARPKGMSAGDWGTAQRVLPSILGWDWRTYGERVAALATRLARRGRVASSALEITRFAVAQALGRPVSAAIGRVRDERGGLPPAGRRIFAMDGAAAAACATIDRQGAFVLEGLRARGKYSLLVEEHDVTSGGTGASIVVPTEGDLYGLEVVARPSAGGAKPPDCPREDGAGLPNEPIRPPEDLFAPETSWSANVISSFDPNEKKGPEGADDEHSIDPFLFSADRMDYTIYFENLPDASAAAQKVVVIDDLPAEILWDTLRLGPVLIGGQDFAPGYDETSYSADAQFVVNVPSPAGGSGVDVPVDFRFDLDPATGRATWVFDTVRDEDDATTGFLPPNTAPPVGEGVVTFSANLDLDAVDEGDEIVNEATLRFDDLQEIRTRFSNRIEVFGVQTPRNPHPVDGATDVEASKTLRWHAPGATTHGVFLWRAGDPKPATVTAGGLTSGLYQPPGGLDASEDYLWQVVSGGDGMVATGPVWSFSTASPSFFMVRADPNDSGGSDISDAIAILGFLFLGASEPVCRKSADVDDDGLVNITDAIYLLDFLFLGGPPPPAPFGSCGNDPTPDALDCPTHPPCSTS